MRFLSLLFLLVFVACVVMFGLENQGTVTVHFLQWGLSTSLAILIGAAYVLGMFSGWAVLGIFRRSVSRVSEVR